MGRHKNGNAVKGGETGRGRHYGDEGSVAGGMVVMVLTGDGGWVEGMQSLVWCLW